MGSGSPERAKNGPALMLAAAVILLLCLFSGEIRDTDVWMHLKSGQFILENRALAVPDPFSYTSGMGSDQYPGERITRHFNHTHEWLSQVVMYLIYLAAGFPGLVAVRAALLILACLLTGWLAFRRSGDFTFSLAATLAAAGMAFHFAQSRPFLATFVFVMSTIAVLETRRWMVLLPPLFLVWANCHSGFVTGWLVLGAYCGEALIRRLRRDPMEDERPLWLTAAACVLLSGVNPNGFRVVQVLHYYTISGIQTNNLEWQRPVFWEPGIYSFLLFGSLLVLLMAGRRARPVDWLLFLGFAAMSLMAVRHTVFVGLVAPVVMAAYLPKWRALPAVALLLVTATLVIQNLAPAVAAGNTLAFRAAEWQVPSGAADFLQAHQIKDSMFNNYEAGGYLAWRLWPTQRVFIDGRGLSEEAFADYQRILMNTDGNGGSAERLLRKYGIRVLVVEGFDYLSGQVYPLVAELTGSPGTEWRLVYADSKGVVIMRRPPPGIEPLDTPGALFRSLSRQCEEHLRHDPRRPRCARGLSEFYAAKGDPAQAERWMAYYLNRKAGPDPEAAQIYHSLRVTSLNNQALLLQTQGNLADAEQLFRQAVTIAETMLGPDHADTAGSLNNLAGLLESKGDIAGAEALYRRALAIAEKTLGPDHPHTATSLDNLAVLLDAKGDFSAAEPLYRRALAISQKALGPDHPTTQTIRQSLAVLSNRR